MGITNTRLNTAKRGIAVELAARLVAAVDAPVCVLGADPTDRDVARRMPQLVGGTGKPARMHLQEGPHSLDVAFLAQDRLCIASVSDRTGLEVIFPELRERFGYIIVDAPSGVGSGVGIAHMLLGLLDVLLVATGFTAGELADTRSYLERLQEMPSARHVDVRVVSSGDPDDSGLATEQLERRLRALRVPTIGSVPRLWGRRTPESSAGEETLDDAFRPVVDWLVARRTELQPAPTPERAPHRPSPLRHVATRRYREL